MLQHRNNCWAWFNGNLCGVGIEGAAIGKRYFQYFGRHIAELIGHVNLIHFRYRNPLLLRPAYKVAHGMPAQ